VARLPLAFLVRGAVAAGDARKEIDLYMKLDAPVYALLQSDGTASLYVGAFETPEQAALMLPTLRQAGIAPVLVYRTGRVF